MTHLSAREEAPQNPDRTPLVVDLDGTLIKSDLLVESAFAHLGRNPLRLLMLVFALTRGKAALKSSIAAQLKLDVAHLPYDEEVLRLIREARQAGARVYLASASNEHYVNAIAQHLGLFDGCYTSNEKENLSSSAKARCLVAAFGKRGFDYIGNDSADIPVWAVARRCVAVRTHLLVRSKLLTVAPDARFVEPAAGRFDQWVKLLRVHQWSQNALVLVPLLTAHRFEFMSIATGLAAFLSFSLAASAAYIMNDLVDIEADRKHPSKQKRPLAAGTVPIRVALLVVPALLCIALGAGFAIEPLLGAVLVGYLILTTAYSFVLKRKLVVDIIALASLYTLRVVGGAAAIVVPVSEWLLGFSMFMFTALALIKRYVELTVRLDANLPDPTNRNYKKSDLGVIAALSAAAGFNAITVFALYISSDTVNRLYRRPELLWLVCPVLMYWIARVLFIAHRRAMDDDPVVFAMKDRNSLLAFALIGAIILAAI